MKIMDDIRISTLFFIIAMDGLPVSDMTDAVNAVVRAWHGGVSLETGESPEVVIPRAARLFRKTISSEENRALGIAGEFLDTVDSLEMLTVEGLFGTPGRKVFRAGSDIFREVSGCIQDELASGKVSEKTAFLLWLLREAGCVREFVPRTLLAGLCSMDGISGFPLWSSFIGKKLELGEKRKVDSYPECDRFRPVFIENMLLKGDDRKEALLEYVRSGGHDASFEGGYLRIDNRMHEVDMDAKMHGRIDRRGVLLRRMI